QYRPSNHPVLWPVPCIYGIGLEHAEQVFCRKITGDLDGPPQLRPFRRIPAHPPIIRYRTPQLIEPACRRYSGPANRTEDTLLRLDAEQLVIIIASGHPGGSGI